MSRNRVRFLLLPVLAVMAVVSLPSLAHAVPVVFNGAGNTQPPFHNPGAPPVDVNSFDVDISITSGSTLFVQGNIKMDLKLSANLGITGATDSPTAYLTINPQSIPISSDVQHISSTPTGSANVWLWDEQTNGFDPGGDGSNPNPLAVLPSTLARADLTNFNVSLINGPGAQVTTNPINIGASGQLQGLLGGLFDLDLDMGLTGTAKAGLSSLTFTQTGSGDGFSGNGLPNVLPPGTNASRNYGLSLDPWGDISGGVNLNIGGNATLDVGGLFSTNFDLSNLINQSLNLSDSFPLPGTAKLADLNPTGYDIVNKDDLQVTIGLDGTGLGLPFGLSSTGTTTLSIATSLTTTLVAPITLWATITGTITFGINASLQVDNIVYQLQDSVPSVVAPEPGSIVLLFVGVAGALPLVLRRIRRKA